MNKIEAFVYKRVKNNYIIKDFLRNIYQGMYDLMPNYESKFESEPIVHENYFFGFHDVTPFSEDSSMILSNHLLIPLRMPSEEDTLEVGYFEGINFSVWHKIGETHSWNYHKGARLQWMNPNEVIYNDCEQRKLVSKIVNIYTGDVKNIDFPIDTVSYGGEYATSFSYGRLQYNMPGYGYLIGDESYLNENTPSETGLFLLDLKNNTRTLLLSLEDISEFRHEESMDGKMHFVTHTEFSFDNRYIAFLHRWYKGTLRNTRLIVYDRVTKQMIASPTTGMVSHYAWNHQNGIVAYCRVENIDSHVYFSGPDMKEWKRCGYPMLNSDGHLHFIDDDWFLVDTYPDKWRHIKLFKVNRKTDEVILLADAKSPKKFVSPSEHKNWKCDLHPRSSADGKWISFDSVHTGVRSLCIMKNEQ